MLSRLSKTALAATTALVIGLAPIATADLAFARGGGGARAGGGGGGGMHMGGGGNFGGSHFAGGGFRGGGFQRGDGRFRFGAGALAAGALVGSYGANYDYCGGPYNYPYRPYGSYGYSYCY
jgi:hypothetical protein